MGRDHECNVDTGENNIGRSEKIMRTPPMVGSRERARRGGQRCRVTVLMRSLMHDVMGMTKKTGYVVGHS